VIPSDQKGEAEFILFGHLAEQVAGMQVHRVIENNQPTQDAVTNIDVAARKVCFPLP